MKKEDAFAKLHPAWESIPACLAIETDTPDRAAALDVPHKFFEIVALRATPRRALPYQLEDGLLSLAIDGRSYAELPLAALDLWLVLAAPLILSQTNVLTIATAKPARVFVNGRAYRRIDFEQEKPLARPFKSV
jgi:hypothetical protein